VVEAGRVVIRTPRPTAALHVLTGWAVQQRIELEDLRAAPVSLEDVYLRLAESEGSGQDRSPDPQIRERQAEGGDESADPLTPGNIE
jgi:hypothetical protein